MAYFNFVKEEMRMIRRDMGLYLPVRQTLFFMG